MFIGKKTFVAILARVDSLCGPRSSSVLLAIALFFRYTFVENVFYVINKDLSIWIVVK